MKIPRFLSYGILFLGLFSISIVGPGSAKAASYPARPVEVVVPFGAGSGVDRVFLSLSPYLEKELGQKFLPNYKSGGGGTIGTAWLAKAKPDGYNLGLMPIGPVIVKPTVSKLPYSSADFLPIAQIAVNLTLMYIRDDSKWKSLGDLISDAKQSPERHTYATSGPFSMAHLAMEAWLKKTALKIKHVPFEGAGKLVLALMGNQVDFVVSELPHESLKDGKIRPLASFTEKRIREFPNTPTLKESGYDIQSGVWYALVAPKGTPQEIIDKLENAAKKILTSQEFQDKFYKVMGIPVTYLGSKEMAGKWEREQAFYKEIAGTLNIQ